MDSYWQSRRKYKHYGWGAYWYVEPTCDLWKNWGLRQLPQLSLSLSWLLMHQQTVGTALKCVPALTLQYLRASTRLHGTWTGTTPSRLFSLSLVSTWRPVRAFKNVMRTLQFKSPLCSKPAQNFPFPFQPFSPTPMTQPHWSRFPSLPAPALFTSLLVITKPHVPQGLCTGCPSAWLSLPAPHMTRSLSSFRSWFKRQLNLPASLTIAENSPWGASLLPLLCFLFLLGAHCCMMSSLSVCSPDRISGLRPKAIAVLLAAVSSMISEAEFAEWSQIHIYSVNEGWRQDGKKETVKKYSRNLGLN